MSLVAEFFLCAHCSRVFGDASAQVPLPHEWAAAHVVLCEIANTVRLAPTWLLSAEPFDAHCLYRELVCACATVVGRFYVATTPLHDAFRDLYVLLRSAVRSVRLDPLVLPLGQRVSSLTPAREHHALALQSVGRSAAASALWLRAASAELAYAADSLGDDTAATAAATAVAGEDSHAFAVASVSLLPPDFQPAAPVSKRKRAAPAAVAVAAAAPASSTTTLVLPTPTPAAAAAAAAAAAEAPKRRARFGDSEIVCPKNTCRRSFAAWDAFAEHCIREHKCKPVVCPLEWCSRVFASTGMHTRHWELHATPGVPCPDPACNGESFANWRVYRDHCRQYHLIKRHDRVCSVCQHEAPDHVELELHVMQRHPRSAPAVAMGVY